MSFLLDTNIISAHLRRPAALAHRFFQYSGRVLTTSVVLGELFVWAYNRPDPTKILNAIDELLSQEVNVLDFDRDCANEFGRVRIQLRRSGIEVPSVEVADFLIRDRLLERYVVRILRGLGGVGLRLRLPLGRTRIVNVGHRTSCAPSPASKKRVRPRSFPFK